MNRARFTVADGHRLLDGDTEILGGPTLELEAFAHWLNADPPKDSNALRNRLQAMIMVTRGCSFAPLIGLRGDAK